MTRVVRNKLSCAFLDADGGRVADFCSARDFEDVKSGMEACEEHGLADVELLLVMGTQPNAEYDIASPLSAEQRRGGANTYSFEGGRA